MASSRNPTTSMARRFKWLAAAIVAVIALYTAGWFYAADRLVTEANAAIEQLSKGGNRAQCEDVDARGYPFRIGLHCASIMLERRAQGVAVHAGAFRSAAQFYAPLKVIAELDGPARLNIPGLLPLDLTWKTLRSSARLARPLPERISIETGDIAVEADLPDAGNAQLFKARHAELHVRPHGADVDLALRVNGFIAGTVLTGVPLPEIDAVADLNLIGGTAKFAGRNFNPRGAAFDVRSLKLAVDGGGDLTLSGRLAIDDDGLINADLSVKSGDAAALLATVSKAFPEIASQMNALGAGLAALGPDQALPLTIRKSEVTLAFIKLGSIPPL